MWRGGCISIGTPLRSSTSSTCASSSRVPGLRRQTSSALTKYRSKSDTSTGSSSAIWNESVRFGSAGTAAANGTWTCFMRLWARKARKKYAWRSWICGSRFVSRRSATLRKRPFCLTSSTSFAISARPSIKSERPNMAASIKGQKYVLLSHEENLTNEGRKSLRLLLKANKRLNTAYILRESFDQLWDYKSEAWARRFFDNWKAQLRWQRLKPYETFAEMIERHWDGIAAYCRPENKIALGFVEGLNHKIRVLQRRAYGLRDEEYLKLKILTASLPEL